MRFFEFNLVTNNTILESARIQHAEDIVFWEGSKGAIRALQSLINLENGDHRNVTVKWDGSPAVIFGRDADGNFVFTDKSGFAAKGYDGKSKTPSDLESMLLNRPGAQRNPESYSQFAANMKQAFEYFEAAVPHDFIGFFKGDMLYFNTPSVNNGEYVFKPNVVEYRVDALSSVGKRIAQSKTGIVIHREVDEDGNESNLVNADVIQQGKVLVVPPVTAQEPPRIDKENIQNLKAVIAKNASAIDLLLDTNTLTDLKIKDLPNIFYTYTNSKVDTGMDNLGKDFLQWLSGSKVSLSKQKKIVEYVQQHSQGFNALWEVVSSIQRVKDDIINQFDNQNITVKQSISGSSGGEGYVLAHPSGDIKLVPRHTFSKINRSIER
jgi:hypothetical protein